MNYKSLFKISYGLFIISSGNKNSFSGFIANTVFQLTSDPPQIALCCSKNNFTLTSINENKHFSISVLEQDAKQSLIKTFGYKSSRNTNKFENVKFFTGKTNIPVVTENTIAWFECKVINTVDVGTHIIFIAEILDSDVINDTKKPLTYEYFRTVVKGTAPKNAPTYIDKSKFNINNKNMKKYECKICGYIYDEENGDSANGINPGTKFEDLPDDWVCPICGASKEEFEEA